MNDKFLDLESYFARPMYFGDCAALAAKVVALFWEIRNAGELPAHRDRLKELFNRTADSVRAFQIWVPAIGEQKEFFDTQQELAMLGTDAD